MIQYNAAGTFPMLAKTMYGLEDVLTDELRALGAEEIEPGRRMVSFRGDQRMLYSANLHLRTALRILVPIVRFEAGNADEIYQYLYDNVEWDRYLTSRTTFAFDTVVYSDVFTHSKFVAYRAKDAISDYFTDRENRRPNVSVVDPDIQFHIHIADKTVTLALDSSGESLHKRGYRIGQNDAPISEVLAAGILLRSGWEGQSDLLDPMCGSGTFLTEAAMIAKGIPPGIFREQFAFEKWQDFNEELWGEIVEEWEEKPFEYKIYGSDVDAKSIGLSRANIKKAGLSNDIELSVQSITDYTVDNRPADSGMIVMNPPYGERMRPDALSNLYDSIGSTLKHAFMGWKAWIISGSIDDGFNAIGLKHFHREKLYNGMIECELRAYELFDGKRENHLRELNERGEYPRQERRDDRADRSESKERKSFKYNKDKDGSYGGKKSFSRGSRDRKEYRPSGERGGDRRDFRPSRDRNDDRRSGGGDRDSRSFRPSRDRYDDRRSGSGDREPRSFRPSRDRYDDRRSGSGDREPRSFRPSRDRYDDRRSGSGDREPRSFHPSRDRYDDRRSGGGDRDSRSFRPSRDRYDDRRTPDNYKPREERSFSDRPKSGERKRRFTSEFSDRTRPTRSQGDDRQQSSGIDIQRSKSFRPRPNHERPAEGQDTND